MYDNNNYSDDDNNYCNRDVIAQYEEDPAPHALADISYDYYMSQQTYPKICCFIEDSNVRLFKDLSEYQVTKLAELILEEMEDELYYNFNPSDLCEKKLANIFKTMLTSPQSVICILVKKEIDKLFDIVNQAAEDKLMLQRQLSCKY